MPRANVKDKRKQQLMEANLASIAKRGLTETTIEHVSKGANMSRGIVNFYFTSKEKMMLETLTFLTDECTGAWQTALEKSASSDPVTQIENIIKTLLGDKVCSSRRLAVMAAFVGHAGTHKPYAKIIHAADELLATKLIELGTKVTDDKEYSKLKANQIIAMIRGHWLSCAIGSDEHKPSAYSADWAKLICGEESSPARPKKEAPKQKAAAPKPAKLEIVKKAQPSLAIGDLFGQ